MSFFEKGVNNQFTLLFLFGIVYSTELDSTLMKSLPASEKNQLQNANLCQIIHYTIDSFTLYYHRFFPSTIYRATLSELLRKKVYPEIRNEDQNKLVFLNYKSVLRKC